MVKCDDNEQYSRRSCMRIQGVELNLLEDYYSSVNLLFDANDIDRVGTKVKSILVKFRSWKARQRFYNGQSRYYADSSKKPSFTVSVDLTKRRYLLLIKAKGLIKGNSNIKCVYSDINCSLSLRFKDDLLKHFNSKRELLSLLNV